MSDDKPQAALPNEPVTPLETAAEEEPATFEPAESTEPAEPAESVDEVPAEVSSTEPVLATEDPAAVEFAPVPAFEPVQTVYVAAPNPPRKRGNRGVGVLIALAATVVFGVLFAVAVAVIRSVRLGIFSFSFVSAQTFYVPVLFFAVGFILLVLIVNRASWWAYIFGSLFVGVFVYFGTIGTLLLTNGVIALTPDQAASAYNELLTDPYIISAALIAREVSLWMGAAISARGRRVKQRNVDARAAYERESADRNDNAIRETA
jgi:hypothetical protein